MRPFVVTLPAKISTVTPVAEGYAVTTDAGVELVSLELERIGSIPAASGVTQVYGDVLRELGDGRLVACSRTGFCSVFVGRRGGGMESLVADGEYVFPPLDTTTGFVAAQWQHPVLWIDEAGRRRQVPLPLAPEAGVACSDRIVIKHEKRLVCVDASGKERAARDVPRFSELFNVVAECVVLRWDDEAVKLLDPTSLEEIETLQLASESRGVVQVFEHAGSVITAANGTIEYRGRWKQRVQGRHPKVVGEFLVVGGDEETQVLAMATGSISRVPVKHLFDAAALGDGVVLIGTPTIWWRPGKRPVELEHDYTPRMVKTVPAGVMTADRRQLYLWRDGIDGPELAPIAANIPFGRPVIADGGRVIVRSAGKFSLICEINGVPWPLDADQGWRFPLEAPEAAAIVERLFARDFTDPLPAIADRGARASKALIQLPPTEVVALHGRALFERGGLSEAQRHAADCTRHWFLGELCLALQLRPRVLLAQLRVRDRALAPPRALAGYDYLGPFTTSGNVWVADPCYFNQRARSQWLGMTLEVREGRWHAFAYGDPTEEIVVIHDDGFGVEARTAAGSVGVDAGCAGVFDERCPNIDLDFGVQEGTCFGLGALTHSFHGDGGYPVYTGKLGNEIAKIRIAFADTAKRDRAIAMATSGRPYSAKERFALGEAIEHPSFGIGTVTAVQPGKIDVAFAGGSRTLVHGRS